MGNPLDPNDPAYQNALCQSVNFDQDSDNDPNSPSFNTWMLHIGEAQGKAIKLLHESCQKGSPFVLHGEVKKAMGLESSSRVRDSFKGKTSESLWGTLIIRERDTLRLNI